jgi:hypothetical protein
MIEADSVEPSAYLPLGLVVNKVTSEQVLR